MIRLKEHNAKTYKNVKDLFKKHNRVAVIQATGTGKSYIIGKYIEENKNKKVCFLSPSTKINNRFKTNFKDIVKRVEFYTYTKLLFISDEDIEKMKFDIIVLDEYHRCGAKEWGERINKLLSANEGSKVLGTTATPVRTLDNNKDMTEILFNNIVANEIGLNKAIEYGILPKPRYVIGLYNLGADVERIKKSILDSYNVQGEKTLLRKKLANVSKNFQNSCGVSNILKKYITDEKKVIVFCENKEHLINMKKEVSKWFKIAFQEPVYTYEIYSENKKNDHNIMEFEVACKDGFHLLFCVNMLNEGLHIRGLKCAMFLRNTISPTIFFQQCGRVLETGETSSPIIFDFVNNTENILYGNFYSHYGLDGASGKSVKNKFGISFNFEIYDETQDIVNIFNEIEKALYTRWDMRFEQLVAFEKEHGHCSVPKSMRSLNKWVNRQRAFKNEISKERKEKLDSIGFPWDFIENMWENNFNKLLKFKEKYGTCKLPTNYEDRALYNWVKTQRRRNNEGTILKERFDRLSSIGFEWEPQRDTQLSSWLNEFDKLLKFKEEHGHCNVSSRYEDKKLANWVAYQRKRKDKIEKWKIDKLVSIGFKF